MVGLLYWLVSVLAAVLAGEPSLFWAFALAKVLLVPVLFYAWGRSLPKAFWWGMLFAWIGDVSMLWAEREASFMIGMGSFALMWVCYGVGWLRVPAEVRGMRYGLLVGAAVGLGLGIGVYLWPVLRVPFSFLVPGYAIFLVGAGVVALRLREALLWLGILSFWVSDALIAYTKFVQPLSYGEHWIIGLYALGHGLIGARTGRVFLRSGTGRLNQR